MWKYKLLIVSFILLLLAGCQSSELSTPTPFPPTPEEISLGVGGSLITPVPAVLIDMMANPEFYEGAYMQVTGQYFRRPLQVCGTDPQPSPAGWDLVVGETRVPAGGFNEQLRQLMPDGITMTVIGRLTQWQGPVGCGKQAVPTEMWYLDVVKMVDPAQLALVTLTPGSGSGDLVSDGGITDELFTPVADFSTPVPAADGLQPTSPPAAPPTNTVVATRVVPIETLGAGFTPVATDAIASTPTVSNGGTAVSTVQGTAVISGTVQSTPGVSTVTNTPPPGSTATPTSDESTPVAIATADGSTTTSMDGSISEYDFKTEDLAPSEIHEWTVSLESGMEVIIAVIGESGMDINIKILDENLNELVNQDNSSDGEAESVTFDPPTLDNYKVQVSEVNGSEGGYLLTIGVDDNLMPPQGSLIYGSARSSTIYLDELHYWFFKGSQNDVIDLAISSDAGANLLITLYGSDGDYVEDLFLVEEIEDVVLPETGWYVFEFEEWGLDENSYQITLSKQ